MSLSMSTNNGKGLKKIRISLKALNLEMKGEHAEKEKMGEREKNEYNFSVFPCACILDI